MDREEELARMTEDHNMAENEAENLSQEMHDIEKEYPDSFEEDENWNDLDCEVRALENQVAYLNNWIAFYKEGCEV